MDHLFPEEEMVLVDDILMELGKDEKEKEKTSDELDLDMSIHFEDKISQEYKEIEKAREFIERYKIRATEIIKKKKKDEAWKMIIRMNDYFDDLKDNDLIDFKVDGNEPFVKYTKHEFLKEFENKKVNTTNTNKGNNEASTSNE